MVLVVVLFQSRVLLLFIFSNGLYYRCNEFLCVKFVVKREGIRVECVNMVTYHIFSGYPTAGTRCFALFSVLYIRRIILILQFVTISFLQLQVFTT